MLVIIMSQGMTAMAVDEETPVSTGKTKCDEWFECLDQLAYEMEENKFWYSNSNNSRTFEGALKKAKVSNCARYVAWALQRFGVVDGDKVFWLEKGGGIKGDASAIKNNPNLTILYFGKASAKCDLEPGDICGWKSIRHTAVYAGKDAGGRMLWYSAGGEGGTRSGGKIYFKADKMIAKPRGGAYNGVITTVIRIKGLNDAVDEEQVDVADNQALDTMSAVDIEEDAPIDDREVHEDSPIQIEVVEDSEEEPGVTIEEDTPDNEVSPDDANPQEPPEELKDIPITEELPTELPDNSEESITIEEDTGSDDDSAQEDAEPTEKGEALETNTKETDYITNNARVATPDTGDKDMLIISVIIMCVAFIMLIIMRLTSKRK